MGPAGQTLISLFAIFFVCVCRIVLISGRRSFYSVFSVLPYRDCSQAGYVSSSMPKLVTSSSLCPLLSPPLFLLFLWMCSPSDWCLHCYGGCIFTIKFYANKQPWVLLCHRLMLGAHVVFFHSGFGGFGSSCLKSTHFFLWLATIICLAV